MEDRLEVLRAGDEAGNNKIVRIRLSSGRDVYGFATENGYIGDWSLGPTWNYLVTSERPFLVDTGKRGEGGRLLEMMNEVGVAGPDLLVVSHGHEDHDGGLHEMVRATGAAVLAHKTYGALIATHPDRAPSADKREFPASCWDCGMPASFYAKRCLPYHDERRLLEAGDVEELPALSGGGVRVVHVPGHSPDSVALWIDDEVLIVGDTILPDITPHPTREAMFGHTRGVLPSEYTRAPQLYGLQAYLESVGRLGRSAHNGRETLVLPGHRLFHKGRWQLVALGERVEALATHHLERCEAILTILAEGPKTAEGIARVHFDAKLLEGHGATMATLEILSHCELLERAGDLVPGADGSYERVGDGGFETLIASLAG